MSEYGRYVLLAMTMVVNGGAQRKETGMMVDVSLEKSAQARGVLVLRSHFPVPATSMKFVASEMFVVDTDPNTRVRISEMCPMFVEGFLGKVEPPLPGGRLYVHMVKDYPVEVMAEPEWPLIELGGEACAESFLSDLYNALATQGGIGCLSMVGDGNIFFIRNVHGILCQVRADWSRGGWRLVALSAYDPRLWTDHDRFIIRDPAVSPASA